MTYVTMALELPSLIQRKARESRDPLTLEQRASGGDRDALAELLRQHGAAVQQLCHFVAGPADARDAAQEAFERIVVSIRRFDPERGPFRPWALAVARNVCRDRLRKRGRERISITKSDTAQEQAISEAPGPERRAEARSTASALNRALESLPEPMRTALVLFHFQEASYEEIAATLGVPKGTVMTWLHRGRERLKAVMAQEQHA